MGLISITTGITISSIVFVVYVFGVWMKYGILPSISHSYYEHYEKWLFFLFMLGIGLPITLMATSGLLFFSGVLFILCGCAPAFKYNKYSLEDELHVIGAEGGISLAILALVITYGQWWVLPTMLIPTGYMMKKKVKNHTWWIEILAFVIIALGFILI